MTELSLKIIDKTGKTVAVSCGVDEVNLVSTREYTEGDMIVLEVSKNPLYLWLQVDDAIGESLVYLTGNVSYRVPFGEKRIHLSPKAFYGGRHLLSARVAKKFEIEYYRNLALNVCDQHDIENLYPHATANVETRGEAVFAAQNAIDGVRVNCCHGEWPYQSWGINRREDAKLRLDFGREVEVDRIVLYTRADFPHDSWWKQVSFSFSDGSRIEMKMEKSVQPHEIVFEPKQVLWLEVHDMKKADDPSPFPALTQMEVYGREKGMCT